MKYLLEYIWLDANDKLRSKIKISDNLDLDSDSDSDISDNADTNDNTILDLDTNAIKTKNPVPMWNFDGSSTGQAVCSNSDVILKPVKLYQNPFFSSKTTKTKINTSINMISYIVLCECLNKDLSPHVTNHRDNCTKMYEKYKENKCLFGIEQEYVIFENDKPYKWHTASDPLPNSAECVQGEFYCSVGSNKAFGREISEKHLLYCLEAGIHICGTNAEVAPSQWEFQIGTCDMLTVSDDLIVARYILDRIAEEHNCFISLEPKPFGPKWNGSGGHTNFSTGTMREKNGIQYIYEACEKLKETHTEHMKVYGKDNEQRLTGIHETSSIHDFSYGVADRSCSIRIPLDVSNKKCGYLEDRRPASNLNPYLVTATIVNTVCSSK